MVKYAFALADLTAALLISLDTAARAQTRTQEQAIYQGKTVSEWVKALDDSDAKVRAKAAEALGRIGAKGKEEVQALIRALRDSDSSVRSRASTALGRIGKPAIPALIVALKDSDDNVRRGSAVSLGEIGPDGKEALPFLIERLKDKTTISPASSGN